MNKKAISILLTAAMGVSVLAAGTVTVSAAEKKDKVLKELLVESTEITVSVKESRKMTRLKS